MNYKLSKYIYFTDLVYNSGFNLLYSTLSGSIILLSNETIDYLRLSIIDRVDYNIVQKLIDLEFLVPDYYDETTIVLEEMIINKKDMDYLSYVIAPTANCQLGCSYCGQVHSKVNMGNILLDKIYNYIKSKVNTNKYKKLNITWYGAEPLMGISSMKNISDNLISLAKERNVKYEANIITNGLNLNLKNFVDLVVNMKVTSYQITIDGVKETHDKSRYTKYGRPTFDIIVNNVIKIVNHELFDNEGIVLVIRVNVHKNNYEEINGLLEYFHDVKLHDKIYVDFAPVHDWGENNVDHEIGIDIHEYAEMEIEWFIKMKELGFKEHNRIPDRILNTCMTTESNSELIDAKGEISYCWEVPYTPKFADNKDFIIGNLFNDNIQYRENYPLRDWFDDIKIGRNNSQNCKSCIYLPVCGGHCPIAWYKNRSACPSFKYNMEQRIILEQYSFKV